MTELKKLIQRARTARSRPDNQNQRKAPKTKITMLIAHAQPGSPHIPQKRNIIICDYPDGSTCLQLHLRCTDTAW